MRPAGREALHRSAVHLTRGTTPALLQDLALPRTLLPPQARGPLPGAGALTAAGVSVLAVPDCGHHVVRDDPVGFARAGAAGARRAGAPAAGRVHGWSGDALASCV